MEAPERERDSAVLREQIADLAAEVVNLTALLEGPDSPVWKALDEAPARSPEETSAPSEASLAGRIRALRDAAGRR